MTREAEDLEGMESWQQPDYAEKKYEQFDLDRKREKEDRTAVAVVTVPDAPSLLDVETGELLPATIDNAAAVLRAARTMKERINDVIAAATAFLAEQSAYDGTKTFHVAGGTISLTGGTSVEYDAADLMEALRVAGCPEDRIEAAVVAEISYKVNRSVLRQLGAANPDYRAAIELSERQVEKPYRASLKGAA